MFGLSELADKYADLGQETSYWAEADRLGQMAVDAGGEKMAGIERVLLALLDYRSSTMWRSSSKAVIYYNLALISRAKNNQVDVDKYLQLARQASDTEVTNRLKLDPRLK